jgi:TRAP-type mannitol/chloroaromatic compound transport system permease large subunit
MPRRKIAGAMLALLLVMLPLGSFLDTLEIIFVMAPVFGPPLPKFGYDLVWLDMMVGIGIARLARGRLCAGSINLASNKPAYLARILRC